MTINLYFPPFPISKNVINSVYEEIFSIERSGVIEQTRIFVSFLPNFVVDDFLMNQFCLRGGLNEEGGKGK